MTKTKAIRLLNEIAEKLGYDLPVMLLFDAPKRKIAWYKNEHPEDSELLWKTITIKDIIDGTSAEDWNPSDLRETIKNLQKKNTEPEKMWVRPEESEAELKKFEEENKDLCESREREARELLANY